MDEKGNFQLHPFSGESDADYQKRVNTTVQWMGQHPDIMQPAIDEANKNAPGQAVKIGIGAAAGIGAAYGLPAIWPGSAAGASALAQWAARHPHMVSVVEKMLSYGALAAGGAATSAVKEMFKGGSTRR
jgi:hypothetical protein